jgi:hypothetical protein
MGLESVFAQFMTGQAFLAVHQSIGRREGGMDPADWSRVESVMSVSTATDLAVMQGHWSGREQRRHVRVLLRQNQESDYQDDRPQDGLTPLPSQASHGYALGNRAVADAVRERPLSTLPARRGRPCANPAIALAYWLAFVGGAATAPMVRSDPARRPRRAVAAQPVLRRALIAARAEVETLQRPHHKVPPPKA